MDARTPYDPDESEASERRELTDGELLIIANLIMDAQEARIERLQIENAYLRQRIVYSMPRARR